MKTSKTIKNVQTERTRLLPHSNVPRSLCMFVYMYNCEHAYFPVVLSFCCRELQINYSARPLSIYAHTALRLSMWVWGRRRKQTGKIVEKMTQSGEKVMKPSAKKGIKLHPLHHDIILSKFKCSRTLEDPMSLGVAPLWAKSGSHLSTMSIGTNIPDVMYSAKLQTEACVMGGSAFYQWLTRLLPTGDKICEDEDNGFWHCC